ALRSSRISPKEKRSSGLERSDRIGKDASRRGPGGRRAARIRSSRISPKEKRSSGLERSDRIIWRRGSEWNRRIKVLQTSPLPLGYRARINLGRLVARTA